MAIKQDKNNARKHSDKNKNLVNKSLSELGAGRSVLLDASDTLIAGNATYEQAEKLGIPVRIVETDGTELIAVKRTDLQYDDPRRTALAIVDNSANDLSSFKEEIWEMKEFERIDLGEWGVPLPGEEENEEEVEETELEAEEDDYEIPDVIQTDIVKGDLITFHCLDGRVHKVFCGSCTDSDLVSKLMGAVIPDLVYADPPYGIDVVNSTVGGSKAFGSKKTRVINSEQGGANVVKANEYDSIIGDQTTQTAKDFYNTCLSLGYKNFLIWGGNYFTDFLPPRKCWIIWDKKGREWDDNFSDFEMAWTSYNKPSKIFTHLWMGMVQQGAREKRVHPTQKPTELNQKVLTHLGDFKNVFDGFGGSFSTMTAVHKNGGTCFSCELSEKYCQVSIDRMTSLDETINVKINGIDYNKKLD